MRTHFNRLMTILEIVYKIEVEVSMNLIGVIGYRCNWLVIEYKVFTAFRWLKEFKKQDFVFSVSLFFFDNKSTY